MLDHISPVRYVSIVLRRYMIPVRYVFILLRRYIAPVRYVFIAFCLYMIHVRYVTIMFCRYFTARKNVFVTLACITYVIHTIVTITYNVCINYVKTMLIKVEAC